MTTHRVGTTIRQDRTVLLEDLPFQAGESVEVVISTCTSKRNEDGRYLLRGAPINYYGPTEPVEVGDWTA